MNIAQIVCVYPPYRGGMGNVARDFAWLAHESGHKSNVITVAKDKDKGTVNENGILIKRLEPFLRYGNGAFLPQLFLGLKDFDVVHLHYPFFGSAEVIYLAKAVLCQRFKLVIHYHMDTPALSFTAKALSVFSRLIEKRLFKIADAITYASESYMEKSAVSDFFVKNKQKFILLPFGVDTERFKPRPALETPNTKYILFVGGLDKAHYFKGIENLLRASQHILSDTLHLRIVGKGDMEDDYKKLAKDLGINEFVDFAGGASDEDLVKHYQGASLLVLPSINGHEAFGIVLLEAFACGVPVVASNLPGVSSVFSNGVQGFFVEPNNIDDLKEKIQTMFADENKRRIMGDNARHLAEDKYSFESIMKNLKNLYENLPNK